MPIAIALSAAPFALRPYGETDLWLYAALFADAGVMRAVGEPFASDRSVCAASASLRHQRGANGRFRYWVIEHGDEVAGLLGLALRGDAWRGGEAELGVLLWPAWQSRGAATAAIPAVRDWAFDVAALAALTCHHAEGHAAAAALMRRIGFSPCTPRPGAPLPCGWEYRAAAASQHAGHAALG